MASLHLLKSTWSPISNFPGKSPIPAKDSHGVVYGFRRRCYVHTRKVKVARCSVQGGDNKRNGEEPPESLFMKELKRRGMTPTSLLEDANRGSGDGFILGEKGEGEGERGGFSPRRNAVSSAELEKSLSKQRERSMALNSEGLEGLIPRAKLLLTIGGTFFLGFGPLILITVGFFSALYFYFGPTFVHDASNRSNSPPNVDPYARPNSPPPYVDPYALLEDERISQTAPTLR